MIRTALALCFLVIFVLLSASHGLCQSENPLAAPFIQPRIGIEGGISMNQQQGEYASNCGCIFPTGSGTGITVNGLVERYIGYNVSLVGRLGIQIKNTTSSLATDTNQTIFSKVNNDTVHQHVPLTEQATANLTYIFFNPMVRYYVVSKLFAEVGPSFGFLLSSHLHAQETANEFTFTDGSTTRVIQDAAIPNSSSIYLALVGGIGYNFQLKGRLTFSPEISAALPMTSVQSGSNWKIMSYQITGTLSWEIRY